MAKDIWCITNAVDTAVASATGAVQGLGPTRVQDPRIGKVWRPAVAADILKISFSQPVQIDVLAVAAPTMQPGQTFDLKISTSAGAGDVFNGVWSPLIDPRARTAYWIAEQVMGIGNAPTASEITLHTIPAPGIIPDIGRVWAGKALWRPEIGHVYGGGGQAVIDLSTVQYAARSGAVFADTASRIRTHEVNYDAILPNEWNNEARDLSLIAGMSRQLVFVPNWEVYQPHKHAIIGYQEAMNPISALGFERFQQAYRIREAG